MAACCQENCARRHKFVRCCLAEFAGSGIRDRAAPNGKLPYCEAETNRRMKLIIDTDRGTLTRVIDKQETSIGLFTKDAFEEISRHWVRVGWALRYYHNFSWFGLPILQLPEDLVRLQEVIYRLRPAAIVETGVYRGGSLLFHASILEALGGEGRVIGVDLVIPPEVREAVTSHPLSKRITLIEGDSCALETVGAVKRASGNASPVLVILDSEHSKDHVTQELEHYAPLVTPGSYIVATDGVMRDLADVPRGQSEWKTNNPLTAAEEFIARHKEFVAEQPPWLYHDGPITENVTYWPGAWLRRIG
jgi:cephalosporin hydroxylase